MKLTIIRSITAILCAIAVCVTIILSMNSYSNAIVKTSSSGGSVTGAGTVDALGGVTDSGDGTATGEDGATAASDETTSGDAGAAAASASVDTAQVSTPAAQQSSSSGAAKIGSATMSKEQIVAAYTAAYNKTKATGKFLGKSSMTIQDVMIDGKENSTITKLLQAATKSSDEKDMPLPPNSASNKYMTCMITADDIETATYKDNGNGTVTIKLVPKRVVNPKLGQDAQGKMLNVVDDFTKTMQDLEDKIRISWAEGDANSNTKADTYGGYAQITYNKSTNMISSATYVLVTHLMINHVNVLMFKNKNVTATTVYTQTFPQ
jgi:hypothetical protein